MDTITTHVSEFITAHLTGPSLAWYLYVIICILVLSRCRVVNCVLCWLPLILTVLYFTVRNDLDKGINSTTFFEGFTAGGNIGDTKDAPENSMAALKLALESKNVVMFDVRLASDGKAVVIKDETTNRTMKRSLIVADNPSNSLTNLTSLSSSERIPLLKSVLDECREKDAKVVIRTHESSAALLSEISDYVKKYQLYTKVVVTSGLPTVSFYMKRHDKNMLTGITYSRHGAVHYYQKTHPKSLFFKLLGQLIDDSMQVLMRSLLLPRFIGTEVIFVSYKDVSENFANDVTAQKMHLVAYDVNEKNEQERLHDISVPYFTPVLKA
ncbi:unnamed protein product [Cylicocyclus nassatus]|uniref:GP-PDE domain-containing protein n=1 Tax=Cylicocyclus nassatus TaxID=53992 RepID=A0AA36GJE0_CYLNA|nr:unnamed protein product [Cylicocyclus nassatus]